MNLEEKSKILEQLCKELKLINLEKFEHIGISYSWDRDDKYLHIPCGSSALIFAIDESNLKL